MPGEPRPGAFVGEAGTRPGWLIDRDLTPLPLEARVRGRDVEVVAPVPLRGVGAWHDVGYAGWVGDPVADLRLHPAGQVGHIVLDRLPLGPHRVDDRHRV